MMVDYDELVAVLRIGAVAKIALCGTLTLVFHWLALTEWRKEQSSVLLFEVSRSLTLACFWTVAVQCAVLLDPFLFHRNPTRGLASVHWLESAGWAVFWSLCGLQMARHWLGVHLLTRER